MQQNSAPDIYLMNRDKSRAGCVTVFISALAVLLLAGGFLLWKHPWTNPDAESAEPVHFPAGEPEPSIALPEPSPALPSPSGLPLPPADNPTAIPASPAPSTVAADVAIPPADASAAAALFSKAKESRDLADYQSARESALAALAAHPGNSEIEAFLGELAMPLLASQRPMPEKVDYVVQSGDYLGKISAKFNTPVPLIAKANNVLGAQIISGQNLKVFDGNNHSFAVLVSKSRNDLLLTLDGKFFKRYRVATGREGKTPVGSFKIVDKIAHPPWHKPGGPPIPYGDPANLLGTHWLAIDAPGYGLHGTWDPNSIGGQTSDGCVRLLNEDVEELFTILPRGTVVTITE